jgi:hypothetical protein
VRQVADRPVESVWPVRVGEAVVPALAGGGAGSVVAVFRRAVYLSYPGGLIALVGTDAEPGPLHAHVEVMPLAGLRDEIRVCPVRAPVWSAPPLPAPGGLVRVLGSVLDHEPVLDLGFGVGPAAGVGSRAGAGATPSTGLRPSPGAALRSSPGAVPRSSPGAALGDVLGTLLGADGLAATAHALAGRGAGLTPAGDDVAAGLLLAAHAAGVPEPELRATAEAMGTHAISRAFLGWAARGRSIAAVHDLAAACAAGDVRAARRARARLAAVGHTSGLDLAYGLLVGCTHFGGPVGDPVGDPHARSAIHRPQVRGAGQSPQVPDDVPSPHPRGAP